MKFISSWDDGTVEDVKLIALLKKYNLPGIFFVPVISYGGNNLQMYRGFEIGCHTYSHPQDLKELNNEELNSEIVTSKDYLEDKLNREVSWFCYPRGRFNEQVKGVVDKAGFKFARTTRIGINGNRFEKNGFHCYQRKEYGDTDWLDYIREQYWKYENQNVEFHVWGHSKEIDKNNDWDKLEELFKFLNEHINSK